MSVSVKRYQSEITAGTEWDSILKDVHFGHMCDHIITCSAPKEELENAKDCFSQLKFNFLELETKKLFLERIASGVDLYQSYDTADIELSVKQQKKKLKEEKEENNAVMNEFALIIAEIAELQERYNTERETLLAEVEAFTLLTSESQAPTNKRKAVETQTTTTEPTKTQPVATERLENEVLLLQQQLEAVVSLSGLEVSQQGNQIVITLNGSEQTYLTLNFNAQGRMASASFSPAVIPYEDILASGLELNDVLFIITELQNRLQEHYHEAANSI